MSKIDYVKTIDSMSTIAFTIFGEKVFNELHFNVMSLPEFRKVDAKEKLLSLVKTSITGKDVSLDYYVDEIHKYLDNYVSYKKGSRAEKYMLRAIQLIQSIEKKKRVNNDIQDLVKLFVTIMRESINTEDEIDNINFSISIDDISISKTIFSQKFKSRKKVTLNTPSQSKDGKEICYINTVMYLIEILENEGEFLSKEEQ